METQINLPKKITILIVEDEESLLNALTQKLEGQGYETLRANKGIEGLNKALDNHPDLILLDIIMPDLDGFSLLDTLREDPWGKTVKVIILTNLGIDDDRLNKVVSDQPSYYLMKSDNSLDQILEKIGEVLNSNKEEVK